jgi:hypothetical protein
MKSSCCFLARNGVLVLAALGITGGIIAAPGPDELGYFPAMST